MAELNQTTYSLAAEFDALPDAIQTWLASDHATIYISEINKKLGLKGDRRSIIPTLVLRLVTKDLEPQDFIQELADELNIGYPIAKSLAEEIEAKVLHPIELGLRRDAGVDIKLIYLGATAPAPSVPVPPSPADLSAKTSASAEALAKESKPAEEKPAITPRVIYQERSSENTPKPEIRPASTRIVHYSGPVSPIKTAEDAYDSYIIDLRTA